MATLQLPSFRSSGAFGFVAVLGMVGLGAGLLQDEQELAASSQPRARLDLDGDGLTDTQELVLGTLPHVIDTDGDGYSDMEEQARFTDPLQPSSIPGVEEFNLGMCASQDNGRVTVLWSAFIAESKLGATEFQVGVVRDGVPIRFVPRTYRFSRRFLRNGSTTGDRLSAIEIEIPRHLMRRLGLVTLYGVLRDITPGVTSAPVVRAMNLIDFSGVTVAAEFRTMGRFGGGGGGGGGAGVMGVGYRPIAPANQIPSSWNSGQMCMHSVAAIGMNGAYVIHEIQSADCVSMDTYCSPGDCSAAVGSTLQMPDPAALAGG